MKHDVKLHQERIKATLVILAAGGVKSLCEAYGQVGEKFGAAVPTVAYSWSFANASQKRKRAALDPMEKRRQHIVTALVEALSNQEYETYNRACITVGEQFGVTSVAVRRMAERMPGTHPFWDVLYEYYPDTHTRP